MAVDCDEWLRLTETEYLERFITSGGAAVRFAVLPQAAMLAHVMTAFDQAAVRHDLVRVTIDSATTRLHMIQDVFFGVARQIDWTGMAQRFIERLCAGNGYRWPTPGEPVALADLAAANQVHEILLRKEVKQWLTRGVMEDTAMAQDFRVAMTQLCQNRLASDEGNGTIAPVLEWLRGELRTISALRAAMIHSRITRHNARSMLRSLCHWLRLVGHKGLLVSVDICRLVQTPPAGSDGLRYSPAAVLDAYEVLRQLIDEADHFEGVFVAVLAEGDFIAGPPKRSIECYTALKMRIWDDVRDRTRDNPLAPLVTLANGAGA
jgi:hypothetical protein